MRCPDEEIRNADKAIDDALSSLCFLERGAVARTMLKSMRDLVEHVAMLAVHGPGPVSGDYYQQIKPCLKQLKGRRETRFISVFHEHLQKVTSHYTPTEESSERLLLGYYENLLLLRNYANDVLGLSILANLERFPLETDPGLSCYYEQIAKKVDMLTDSCSSLIKSERYYIHGVKPFFVKGRVYYEVSLLPAFDMSSKFDRIVAFSSSRIPTNYAVSLSIKNAGINALGVRFNVRVIDGWIISIRPCELNNLAKMFGTQTPTKVRGQLNSYRSLMDLLTETGLSLNEIASMSQADFAAVKTSIAVSGSTCPIHKLLDEAHEFAISGKPGQNVVHYLLYKPRNRVIKAQLDYGANEYLGGLHLKYKCIPFDRQPYCMALVDHEPAISDLLRCINPEGFEDNHLARFISNRAQEYGALYIDEAEAEGFGDIDALIGKHNDTLYYKHKRRSLVHEMGQLFIKEDEQDAASTLQSLIRLSSSGIRGYRASCESWLANNPTRVDDPLKSKALGSMFSESKVALIYGSAGTGKTTMVDILCSAFPNLSKKAIANTNPAVDSLRRKISDGKCEFMTVAKYLQRMEETDILVIDECSTISNRDIQKILKESKFKILLLVGDIRQIEAIRLGNWFELAREFLPKKCIHEFTTPWRASSEDLSKLWASVRENATDISEILETNRMTSSLDETLWKRASEDEIVLCLNYDGLYGINNVNRLMQMANSNEACHWGLRTYKVGDPVLFNDSRRFYPALYNNLKGHIVSVDISQKDRIGFSVEVELALSELDLLGTEGLEFIDCKDGKTTVGFWVERDNDPDGEEERLECIVPFQVAYAVSVHKAQGLEYDSVKLVVTKDVEKRITHNVFYTAITRARKKLKIYWSPETQHNILSSFELQKCNKDAQLISRRYGIKLHPDS
jgi:DNA replication protein DnaC